MKKLVFNVSLSKDKEISTLIKKINEIFCRIHIDVENGFVTVEDVNDTMIDSVIELMNNYYTILGIDIDNTEESSVQKRDEAVFDEPQKEEDLMINKIQFKDEAVEEEINKFMRSAYWAIYRMDASPEDVIRGLQTVMSELHMAHTDKALPEYMVGDIVDCNYGYHISGEVNGFHVKGIICNITGNRIFVVPVLKEIRESDLKRVHLEFSITDDVTYYNDMYKGNIVLFDVARYIRSERINSVIGHLKPEFFDKVLKTIPSAFDFSQNSLLQQKAEIKKQKENADKVDNSSNKMGIEELTLYEEIGYAFNNLDKSRPISEQVKMFIIDIGMDISNDLVIQAFEYSLDLKKINYNNVICELKGLNPSMLEEDIKDSLQKAFKKWVENHPQITEKCKRISIISLIQAFAKKLK